MKLKMDEVTQKWSDRARRFAEEELIPCEVEAEMNGGVLPKDVVARHKKLALELGFSAMDVPREHGGHELRTVDQVAVWEQLGRVTNALCWCFSEPQRWMFDACSQDQLQRYVLPMMRGERKECYAITEAESGSDVVINATAAGAGEGYRINGEKWFVTTANLADFLFVQARLADGANSVAKAEPLVAAQAKRTAAMRRWPTSRKAMAPPITPPAPSAAVRSAAPSSPVMNKMSWRSVRWSNSWRRSAPVASGTRVARH